MPFVVNPPTTISTTAEFDIFPSADLVNCIMIEVLNDTTFALNLVLPGSKQSYMAPQTAKFFAGTDWYGDTIKIFPLQVMTGNFTGNPSKITVLGYRQGEQVPPDGTTIDLSKTVFVGNTVTVNGTMNELQNDNNVAGTPILETTVQGQSSTNQSATNDGVWKLGVIISNTIVNFFQSQTVDPIVMLGALNHNVEVLGALITDQNLTVKGSSSLDNGTITTNGSGSITASSETLTGAGTALTVNNNATITGTATIGTSSVTGNETVGGTLTVTGDATLNGAGTGLSVAHDTSIGGNLSVTGTSSFTGDATFNGAGNGVTVANNLDVNGSSNLDNGALTTDGAGNITATSIKGNWQSNAAGKTLQNANTNFTAHAGTYNTDAIGPIASATNTGIALFTRDSGGTFQTAMTVNPGATEYQVWENMYVTGSVTSTSNFNTSMGGVTLNGSTSGTVTIYQFMQGSIKCTLVDFEGYQNNGTAQTLALPQAYAHHAMIGCADINAGGVSFLSSGTAQTISMLNTTSATGGTQSPQTIMKGNSYGMVRAGFDTLQFLTSSGSSVFGVFYIFGV